MFLKPPNSDMENGIQKIQMSPQSNLFTAFLSASLRPGSDTPPPFADFSDNNASLFYVLPKKELFASKRY